MSKKFRTIRGVHDGLPADVTRWRRIEAAAHDVFRLYGYHEVRLPVLEPKELFVRSIGAETDIVSKEMYCFEDRGGDDVCLRPEGTAGAVRAYLQAGLTRAGGQRWWYAGPMFRRERPQKGRLRQFQQLGVEYFGAPGPLEDVEVIAMAHDLLAELGVGDVRLELNSLGCPACRPAYRERLVAFLEARAEKLCGTCRVRMEKNPKRVLDCKVESCRAELADAPEMVNHLCSACADHFDAVTGGLVALEIPHTVNARIVRGLDYYNRTAFEVVTDALGAQGTVIAGGRYDALVEELGGPATPAIGFALGLERLALLLPEAEPVPPHVALVALGDAVEARALRIARELRAAGASTVYCGRGSPKALFKRAERVGADFVLVVGENELARNVVGLRARDGGRAELALDEAIAVCLGRQPLP